MTSLDRVTIAGRAFCIAAILGLGLVSQDQPVIVSLIIIITVASTAVYLSLRTPLPPILIVTVESAITGLVIGLALPGGVVLFPYLIVLSLIAGIVRGLVGVSAAIVTQFVAILVITAFLAEPGSRNQAYLTLSAWMLTSIGGGLLGAWLREAGKVPVSTDNNASYESARRLLSQLRTVARRLSSGLDPVTMANHILGLVQSGASATLAGVFVRTDGGLLSPLAYSDTEARELLSPDIPIADQCWAEMEPVIAAHDVGTTLTAAFPLRAGSRMIGVVLAELAAPPSTAVVKEVMRELDEHSLRLDTAMAFDEVRSIATVEERRRLGREIHDGIAQDIASLGYLVDDLAATSDSDQQRGGLTFLREELTRVVSELRLSIFDLRSEVLPETGLGSALSEYVRQVGSRSTMTVHVTLDEAPTRLRAEAESELLRIAQEAITNARKHSGAANLWVNCTVKPPFACLEVRDDGNGLSQGRADSYGLGIMKERAERINARLDISENQDILEGSGTRVRVTLGSEPEPDLHSESELVDDSTGANHRSARRRS